MCLTLGQSLASHMVPTPGRRTPEVQESVLNTVGCGPQIKTKQMGRLRLERESGKKALALNMAATLV